MTQPTLPSMRIVYFTSRGGEETNAVLGLLKELGQRVPLVVTTRGPAARRIEWYKDLVAGLPIGQDVLVSDHMRRLPSLLEGLKPDLILVLGFPWRLPPDLLAVPRLGSLNVHPALLPRYRGPNPIFWHFMNGETRGGLTVHRMEPEFDTGPILAQSAIDIAPDDDIDSFLPKLYAAGAAAIPEALAKAAAGDPGEPQDGTAASYAPIASEAERRLDWSRSASELRNQVRGWGRHGAKAVVGNRSLLVRRAGVAGLSKEHEASAPGSLLEDSSRGLLVRAGEDALWIEDCVEAEEGE